MMDKPEFYCSDDYAGLEAGGNRFYYGYEYTEGDDWCFRAVMANGNVHQATWEQIRASDQFDVIENLLLGIGWIIMRRPEEIKSGLTNEDRITT